MRDTRYREVQAMRSLGGGGGRRRIGHAMAALALVCALQLGAANEAWAISRVDCFGGPPVPITLITPGGDVCLGGSPGSESVGTFVEDFSSGGYHCRVFFLAEGSDTTLVVSFEPNEFSQLNVHVIGVEIISPGD